MNERLDSNEREYSEGMMDGRETRLGERIQARLSAMPLGQTAGSRQHAMAAALSQAEALLKELVERGRYPATASADDNESDRLLLALALLRTRRNGFEDGAALYAWWRDSVSG